MTAIEFRAQEPAKQLVQDEPVQAWWPLRRLWGTQWNLDAKGSQWCKTNLCHFTISLFLYVSDVSSQEPNEECEKPFVEARSAAKQIGVISLSRCLFMFLTFHHRNPKKTVKNPSLRLAVLPNIIGLISFSRCLFLFLTFHHRNPKKTVKKPWLRLAVLPIACFCFWPFIIGTQRRLWKKQLWKRLERLLGSNCFLNSWCWWISCQEIFCQDQHSCCDPRPSEKLPINLFNFQVGQSVSSEVSWTVRKQHHMPPAGLVEMDDDHLLLWHWMCWDGLGLGSRFAKMPKVQHDSIITITTLATSACSHGNDLTILPRHRSVYKVLQEISCKIIGLIMWWAFMKWSS